MCGLLGFTGDAPADPGKLRVLFLANKSRGTDSTGMFGTRMIKKVGLADNLLSDPNFDNIARNNIVIGHTRSSTGTPRTKENAHPFMFGHRDSDFFVVGAHNGSIFNEYEMETKINGFKRANVDSESIYKAMHLTKDIHVIAMLEGHVALTFRIGDVVYLYRRESRPLFLGKSKEGWYWSSIRDSLKLISIPEEKIFDLEPHKLLAFRGSRLIDSEDIAKPRVSMDSTKTSYNWDNGLSNELKEELTGKKYTPVVDQRTTTGNAMGITTTSTQKAGPLIKTSGETKKALDLGLINLKDLKTIGIPKLYGRNILIPSTNLSSNHDCVNFIGKHMSLADTDLVVYPNKFKSDQSNPFWLKDVNNVIKSNLFIFPQSAEKRPSESIPNSSAKKKDDSISINIRPIFTPKVFNDSYGQIYDPARSSLYFFFKIDEDCFKDDDRAKFMSEAVGFIPIVSNCSSDRYCKINIPSYIASEVSSVGVKIRICIADVRTLGFFWETTVTLEKGCDYTFIAAMGSHAQGFFDSANSSYIRSSGTNVPLNGFKLIPSSSDYSDKLDLEMSVKGVFRALKGSNQIIPLFLNSQIDKKESRSLFSAINNVKKIIEMKFHGEPDSDTISLLDDKKKAWEWD